MARYIRSATTPNHISRLKSHCHRPGVNLAPHRRQMSSAGPCWAFSDTLEASGRLNGESSEGIWRWSSIFCAIPVDHRQIYYHAIEFHYASLPSICSVPFHQLRHEHRCDVATLVQEVRILSNLVGVMLGDRFRGNRGMPDLHLQKMLATGR